MPTEGNRDEDYIVLSFLDFGWGGFFVFRARSDYVNFSVNFLAENFTGKFTCEWI